MHSQNSACVAKRSMFERFLAALVAMVLVVGLAPAASQLAYANDGNAANDATGDTFAVALTVVDTTDSENGTLANVKVEGLTAENTVADLLAKAGFSEASDASATAGNDKAYANSWGSPVFRGGNLDPTYAVYWATMYNGSANEYASAQLTAKLQEGGHYQYIYTGDTSFAYSESIPDPLADTGKDPDSDPDPDPAPAAVNKYDAAKAQSLISNLSARFSKGGSDSSLTNSTFAGAVALNSLGKGANVDSAALVANLDADAGITAGRYGKYLMALTAAGIDCTKATDAKGQTRNLVSEMEALCDPSGISVYDAVCILPVYAYGSYAQDANAKVSIDNLIDAILSSTDAAGLFGVAAYGCDTQTTAQAILALLPYKSSHAGVAAAIEKAQAALIALQNEDGSFGYSADYPAANLDATANVVAALAALGIDCASGTQVTTANGSTPVGYLVAQADADQNGYKEASSYDEPMTSSTVLLALAGMKGAQNAGGAFSVYTLNKVSNDSEPSDEGNGKGDDSDKDAGADAKADDKGNDAAALAATGDAASAQTALVLAAFAFAAGAFAYMRRGGAGFAEGAAVHERAGK